MAQEEELALLWWQQWLWQQGWWWWQQEQQKERCSLVALSKASTGSRSLVVEQGSSERGPVGLASGTGLA